MRLARNRVIALIAVGAMAINALWPLISQAQPRDPTLYATICSVQGGVQTIDLAGGKLPADDGSGKHQQHCKLCVVGGDRVQALPSVPIASFQTSAFVADAIAAHPAAVFRSTSDSPAQPRAPPVQI
jgi:hypothetical protein